MGFRIVSTRVHPMGLPGTQRVNLHKALLMACNRPKRV